MDAAAGWITWSRVGLLGFAGVLIPLLTPREYVPIDPLVSLLVVTLLSKDTDPPA